MVKSRKKKKINSSNNQNTKLDYRKVVKFLDGVIEVWGEWVVVAAADCRDQGVKLDKEEA